MWADSQKKVKFEGCYALLWIVVTRVTDLVWYWPDPDPIPYDKPDPDPGFRPILMNIFHPGTENWSRSRETYETESESRQKHRIGPDPNPKILGTTTTIFFYSSDQGQLESLSLVNHRQTRKLMGFFWCFKHLCGRASSATNHSPLLWCIPSKTTILLCFTSPLFLIIIKWRWPVFILVCFLIL